MTIFNSQRRQQFLMETYFKAYKQHLSRGIELWRKRLPHSDSEAEGRSLASASVASDRYENLSIGYTAGQPIDPLRDELEQVVAAYEVYQQRLGEYEGEPQFAPFNFAHELADYERCMQLIGLCYLLHRRDLLPRIARLQDPTYADEDTLYEELLGHALPDRADIDEWYHDEPYSTLIHAMYAQTPQEASAKLAEYCRQWYPAMADTPWHGGHERMTEDDGDYFGYWAFEAGAVALLYDIDDSQIDHMVYPRDLVAFARGFKPEQVSTSVTRVAAGETCPQNGWWHTPAQPGSRRHFKQGDTFPAIENSAYGATFWLWSPDQSSPSL